MEYGKRRLKMKCNLLPYTREDVYSIQEVRQAAGWEITSFNLSDKWRLSQGEGVKIAVIDTGCDLNHEDLKNNLLQGKNFVNKNKEPMDGNSHGTHVAGTICAENNSVGMIGVAPKSKVIPVKALDDDGSGNMSNIAEAIRWSADQGTDFITMSLGAPHDIPDIRKAIQYALSKKCITFCAAGNAGSTREIYYPANYPETIGIGSIDQNFERAGFSCTGDDLDFLAPGVKIFSTVPTNWYAYMSGTSMSTPFAVGCAALLLSYVRNNITGLSLNNDEDYRKAFRKKTISLKNKDFSGKKFFEGFGIIDPNQFEEWAKNS
jgi:subtilisin family serine protease